MNWGTKKALAVAGGKGGIGKSTFVANLGTLLAEKGREVTVIDADIGAANLHTLIGVPRPQRTLSDFFYGDQSNLKSVIVDTPYQRLKLLSSADDLLAVLLPN